MCARGVPHCIAPRRVAMRYRTLRRAAVLCSGLPYATDFHYSTLPQSTLPNSRLGYVVSQNILSRGNNTPIRAPAIHLILCYALRCRPCYVPDCSEHPPVAALTAPCPPTRVSLRKRARPPEGVRLGSGHLSCTRLCPRRRCRPCAELQS